MRTADDFRRALGEGDESFLRCVEHTLAALPKEEPVVKRKMSVGLAIAVALVMMTMMAAMAANWWGISDFLKNDNLEGMTQGANVTAETEHATFTVTEHIYDGRGIYMVVAVRAKEEGVLPLPQGTTLDGWIDTMVTGVDHVTVAEWAAQNGYTDFVWTAVATPLNVPYIDYPDFSKRAHLESDGTLLIMLSHTGKDLPQELPLVLMCGSKDAILYDSGSWQDLPRVSRTEMSLTLHSNPAEEKHYRSAEPVVYNDLGITVDELRLTLTPLAVYYEIDYTAHNPADNVRGDYYQPGYVFRFMDERGKPNNPGGPTAQMRYTMLDKDAGRGRWFGTLPANQLVQDSVILKGIKGDFTFFDAVQTLAIPLIPAE